MLRRYRSVCHINQFNIQNQVGFGGGGGVRGVADGNLALTEAQLPGNKDAAFSANLHASHSIIPSRQRAALSQDQCHRRRVAGLGLAVIAQNRLAVLVLQRRAGMIV